MSAQVLVTIGETELTFSTGIRRLVHVRGFGLATSYCILELEHSDQEILTEWANYSRFVIQYGEGEAYSKSYAMQIIYSANQIKFSHVAAKIIGVELGFVTLSSTPKIKAHGTKSISALVADIAEEAGLESDVAETEGRASFIQANLTDLQFIVNHLQPIALGKNNEAPYLFTIDDGVIIFRPPTIVAQSQNDYVVSANGVTLVKKFIVRNQGGFVDFISGSAYQGYGYDPVSEGLLSYADTMGEVTSSHTSEFPYESAYVRTETFPYDREWMVKAHVMNTLAKGKFILNASAILDGNVELKPDQINKFVLPFTGDGGLAEYSGNYYTYGVTHQLENDLFVTHLRLVSNSVYKSRLEV